MFDAQENTRIIFAERNSKSDLDNILSRLDIDGEAGTVCWKPGTFANQKPGEAGSVVRGERVVSVDSVKFTAAEIVWAKAHGELPEAPVGYRDGDAANAALSNLFLKDDIQSAADTPHQFRLTIKDAALRNAERATRDEIAPGKHYDTVFAIHSAFALDDEGVIRNKPSGTKAAIRDHHVELDGEPIPAAVVVIALTKGVLADLVLFLNGNPANIKPSNLAFAKAE